jgi:hypothetical protein
MPADGSGTGRPLSVTGAARAARLAGGERRHSHSASINQAFPLEKKVGQNGYDKYHNYQAAFYTAAAAQGPVPQMESIMRDMRQTDNDGWPSRSSHLLGGNNLKQRAPVVLAAPGSRAV